MSLFAWAASALVFLAVCGLTLLALLALLDGIRDAREQRERDRRLADGNYPPEHVHAGWWRRRRRGR